MVTSLIINNKRAACIICLSMLFFCTHGMAHENLCSLIRCQESAARVMPPYMTGSGTYFGLGGTLSSPFTYTIRNDKKTGNISFNWVTGIATLQSNLDPFLRLRDCAFAFSQAGRKNRDVQKIINLLKHDERISRWDETNKKIAIRYFRDGRFLKEKENSYDGFLFDGEHISIYLQVLLMRGLRQSFENDVMISAQGYKLGVSCRFMETVNPLLVNENYTLPAAVTSRLAPGKPYYMFEMKMTGVAGVFHRIKYYFVYEARPPFRFIAYWGGTKGYEEFIVCD